MDNYSSAAGAAGAPGVSGSMAQASSTSANSRDAGLQRADGTPVRVLVVDDEPSLTELLSRCCVRGLGDPHGRRRRGRRRTAREFQPDAVVLDMMLPDIDGMEVLRRLRAEIRDIPSCS